MPVAIGSIARDDYPRKRALTFPRPSGLFSKSSDPLIDLEIMLHAKMRDQLLRLAETLGAHRGVTAPTVFAQVIGDPKAAYRLMEGEDFKVKTVDRWLQKISNAWPDDLPWPEGSFERPAPQAPDTLEPSARSEVEAA